MLTITDRASLTHALNATIDAGTKRLLALRCRQLGGDIEGVALFVVVQPGDTVSALEAELGFRIIGDPELTLLPEWVADSGHVLEAVWLLTDDGFAHVACVPRASGIDPQLIEFCMAHASQHA